MENILEQKGFHRAKSIQNEFGPFNPAHVEASLQHPYFS
jgi:hypothetical protein